MESVTNLLQYVNEQLRIEDLLAALNYYPDRIILGDDRIKCFCPIHGEKVFANLFIDAKKRTFKCTMKKCRGFSGGTIVEFFALVRGIDPQQAALEIARMQGISIESEVYEEVEERLLGQANEAFEKGNLDEAKSLVEQLLGIDPDNLEGRILLSRLDAKENEAEEGLTGLHEIALLLWSKGDKERANALWDEILGICPLFVPTLLERARAMASGGDPDTAAKDLIACAGSLEQNGNYAGALELAGLVAQWNPCDFELLKIQVRLLNRLERENDALQLGTSFYETIRATPDKPTALEALHILIELAPDDPDWLRKRAALLKELGNIDAAHDDYIRIGNLCREKSDAAHAVEAFKAALDITPDDAKTRQILRDLYLELGNKDQALKMILQEALDFLDRDPAKAIPLLQQALAIDPTLESARGQLAQELQNAGQLDAAIEEWLGLAEFAKEEKRPADALAALEKALAIHPNSDALLTRKAEFLAEFGENEKASAAYLRLYENHKELNQDASERMAALEAARKLAPSDLHILELMAGELLETGDEKKAIALFNNLYEANFNAEDLSKAEAALNKILTIDSSDVAARENLAELQILMGEGDSAYENYVLLAQSFKDKNTQKALKHLELAIAARPDDPAAMLMYAEVREAAGDILGACASYERLANGHEKAGSLEETQRCLRKCLALQPDAIGILRRLIGISGLSERQALVANLLDLVETTGKADEIEKEYESALASSGDDPEILRRYTAWARLAGYSSKETDILQRLIVLIDNAAKIPLYVRLLELNPTASDLESNLAATFEALKQNENAAGVYRRMGARLATEDKSQEACEAYSSALRVCPNDFEARQALADLLQSKGDLSEAIQQLEELARKAEKQKDPAKARELLERVLMLDAGRNDLHERLAAICRAQNDGQAEWQYQRLVGERALADHKYKASLASAERMKELAPEDSATLSLLAESLAGLKKNKPAADVFEQLSDLCAASSKMEEASVAIARAIALAPAKPNRRLKLAKSFEALGRVDEAAETYFDASLALSKDGDSKEAVSLLLHVKGFAKNHVDSRRLLLDELREMGREDQARIEALELVSDLYDLDRETEAESFAAGLRTASEADADLFADLAGIEIQHGQAQRAIDDLILAVDAARASVDWEKALEIALHGNSLDSANRSFWAAQIEALEKSGRIAEAIACNMDKASRLHESGDFQEALLYYSGAIRLGDNEAGLLGRLDCFEKLGDNKSLFADLKNLAAFYRTGNKSDQALPLYERMLSLESDSAETLLHLAKASAELGKSTHAHDAFVRLADLADNAEDCLSYLRLALEQAPDDLALSQRIMWQVVRAKGLGEALPEIRHTLEIIAGNSTPTDLIDQYRELLAHEPAYLPLKEELATLLQLHGPKDEAKREWVELSGMLQERNALPRAAEMLARASELDSDDLDLRLDLARLYRGIENAPKARAEYAALVEDLLICDRQSDAAEALKALREIEPGNTQWIGPYAQVLEELGQTEEAAGELEHLSALLAKSGENEKHLDVLMSLLRIAPSSRQYKKQIAELHEQMGQFDEAANEWRALADMSYSAGNAAEAIEILRHVSEIAPDDSSDDALVDLLLAEGQTREARAVLSEMTQRARGKQDLALAEILINRQLGIAPADAFATRELAEILLETGRETEAAERFVQAAELLRDNDLASATEMLRKACGLQPRNSSYLCLMVDLLRQSGAHDEYISQSNKLISLLLDEAKGEDAFALAESAIPSASLEDLRNLAQTMLEHHQADLAERFAVDSSHFLLSEGDAEAALELCCWMIETEPARTKARWAKTDCLVRLGRENQALEELEALRQMYEDMGDMNTVQSCLEQAVEIRPDDADLLARVADAYIENSDTEKAAAAFERLESIAVSHNDLQQRAAWLERLTALVPGEKSYWARLAESYFSSGLKYKGVLAAHGEARLWIAEANLDEATSVLQRVITEMPDHLETMRLLVDLAEKREDWTAHLTQSRLLAEHLFSMGELDNAREEYERLLARYPEQSDLKAALIETLLMGREIDAAAKLALEFGEEVADEEFERADAIFRLVLKSLENKSDFLIAAAGLAENSQHRAEMIDYLKIALTELREKGKSEGSLEIAQRILEAEPEEFDIRQAEGELCEELGKDEEAIAAFAQAARIAARQNSLEQAISLLEHIFDLNPGAHEERLYLAGLLQAIGRHDAAAEQFLNLSDSSWHDGDAGASIAHCLRVLEFDPDHLEAHMRLCRIHEERGNQAEHLEELFWLARHCSDSGELDRADEYLSQAIAIDPENYRLRRTRAEILAQLGQMEEAANEEVAATCFALANDLTDEAIQSMEHARSLLPDHVDLRRRLALLYEKVGRMEEAREEKSRIGDVLLEQGLFAEAREVFDELMKAEPDKKARRKQLAEMYRMHGAREMAAHEFLALGILHKADGDHELVFQCAHTAQSLDRDLLEASELLVNAMLEMGQEDSAYAEMQKLADIYFEKGIFERAENYCAQMLRVKPDSLGPLIDLIQIYHSQNREDDEAQSLALLAEKYLQLGQVDQAEETLRLLLERRPEDIEVRLKYLELYVQIGSEMDLVEDYRKLAQIYIDKGALLEASRVFEKIIHLVPDRLDVREDLIRFLFENGQNTRAQAEIEAAIKCFHGRDNARQLVSLVELAVDRMSDDMDLRMSLVDLYLEAHQKGKAVATCHELLEMNRKSGAKETIAACYRKLIQIDPQAIAIRVEAVEFLFENKMIEQALKQASDLAQLYADRGLLDLSEKMLRRMSDETPSDIQLLRRIIDTHLKVGDERDLYEDYEKLVDQCIEAGSPKDAHQVMERLVKMDAENPMLRMRMIEISLQYRPETDLVDEFLDLANLYVKRREIKEATQLFNRVMQIDPKHLKARQKLDEALAMESGMTKEIPAIFVARKRKTSTQSKGDDAAGAAVLQAIENYQNILKMNPRNAAAHLKLAGLYRQQQNESRALHHLDLASELFLARGELSKVVEACEQSLALKPNNAAIRERLAKAILQRDSLEAIERVMGHEGE